MDTSSLKRKWFCFKAKAASKFIAF
jgi:hypothetical protein